MDVVQEISLVKAQIKALAVKIDNSESSNDSIARENVIAWRAEKLALTYQQTELIKHLSTVNPVVGLLRHCSLSRSPRGRSMSDENSGEVAQKRLRFWMAPIEEDL